jgi:hypothetical protein
MTVPSRSARLIGYKSSILDRFRYEPGEIFWDATNKTLRIFDGIDIGGSILATRTWVSANGGGGGGTAYVLPTATVGTINTGTLGGVKVDGTSVVINNGVISSRRALSTLTDVSIVITPQDGQVLKYNAAMGKWTPAGDLTGDGGSGIGLGSLSVAVATANSGGNLSYNNTTGAFTFTPAVIYSLTAATQSTLGGVYITDVTTSGIINNFGGISLATATTTQLGGVKVDGTTISINGSGVISSASQNSRTTASATTSSLADGASGTFTIVGFKGYFLYGIQTSHAAWVVLYTSNSASIADSSRTETTDPQPNAGVIAEAITSGAQTIIISPAVVGFNSDSLTDIPIRITNKSGSTQAITVTVTLLKMEA